MLDTPTSVLDPFRLADDVLPHGVQGICDLITNPGLINLDFADVRTIMADSGSALMGIGYATGENRARASGRAPGRERGWLAVVAVASRAVPPNAAGAA